METTLRATASLSHNRDWVGSLGAGNCRQPFGVRLCRQSPQDLKEQRQIERLFHQGIHALDCVLRAALGPGAHDNHRQARLHLPELRERIPTTFPTQILVQQHDINRISTQTTQRFPAVGRRHNPKILKRQGSD